MTEKARTIAKKAGMGAIPTAKGVTFRVWAPHAEKVYLIGSFNDWNETSTPLVSDPDCVRPKRSPRSGSQTHW